MRPRETGRWITAVLVVIALWQLTLPTVLAAGAGAGGWGIGATLVLVGCGSALVFTAMYDGPRALVRLVRRAGTR